MVGRAQKRRKETGMGRRWPASENVNERQILSQPLTTRLMKSLIYRERERATWEVEAIEMHVWFGLNKSKHTLE